MAKEILLKFQNSEGTVISVDAVIGDSVMETAVKHDIDDIVAECGGSLICATCHVYLDDETMSLFEPPEDAELDMLEGTAAERRENSRLSCQLVLTEKLAGHTIHTPEAQ